MITQAIGTVRTLADAPNPLTDTQEIFDQKGYAYTLSQKDVNADMQARITELNAAFGQVNTTEEAINILKSDTQAIKELVDAAKDETFLARDNAIGAVSTLPDGVINNNTISETDTWSSSKIKQEIDKKLSKTIDSFMEQLPVTSYNYVGNDLISIIYVGGYKVVYSYTSGNLYQEKFYDTDQTTLLLTKTYSYTDNNLTSETRS